MIAAHKDNEAMAQTILDAVSHEDAQKLLKGVDDSGETALTQACRGSRTKVMRALLSKANATTCKELLTEKYGGRSAFEAAKDDTVMKALLDAAQVHEGLREEMEQVINDTPALVRKLDPDDF
eukprot:TRINITY_DN59550_c0_g1_i1.p3 TRINITY_DN59550_c0_g1~~TRINITY_DN59550_c0_g1_i1.p3  ORF type:complete len:123 (-),score=18.00 TRINITY_DN59550_c0_g1_i1:21-389(-)